MVSGDVCATCGVPVGFQQRTERWLHLDAIPEKVPEHDVQVVVSRAAYLTGMAEAAEVDSSGSPGERSARALERIATALEFIVAAGFGSMDTAADGAVRSSPDPTD